MQSACSFIAAIRPSVFPPTTPDLKGVGFRIPAGKPPWWPQRSPAPRAQPRSPIRLLNFGQIAPMTFQEGSRGPLAFNPHFQLIRSDPPRPPAARPRSTSAGPAPAPRAVPVPPPARGCPGPRLYLRQRWSRGGAGGGPAGRGGGAGGDRRWPSRRGRRLSRSPICTASGQAGRQRPQQAPGAPGCGPLRGGAAHCRLGCFFFPLLLLFAGASLK